MLESEEWEGTGGETVGGKRRLEKGKGKSRGWSEEREGGRGEERWGGEGWGFCPGDARQKLERRRGTGYSPGRRLFHMSAPADSSGQEFRSSFCHRAYA